LRISGHFRLVSHMGTDFKKITRCVESLHFSL
jgi:hypothetical protein